VDLYTYHRSSCSYRVRIALNLKQISHDFVQVNLLEGEQTGNEYRTINPQGLVPFLVDGEFKLFQSLAILEYLEERFPSPPLLPADLQERAMVRALSQVIACDIQPVQNLRVLKYLKSELGVSEEQKLNWIRHFIGTGFDALEAHLQRVSGKYCFSDQVSLVDLCLVPQVYNARRFEVSMGRYPSILRVCGLLQELEAFQKAAPENHQSH
jgi:maleylacetoacetate isomerase